MKYCIPFAYILLLIPQFAFSAAEENPVSCEQTLAKAAKNVGMHQSFDLKRYDSWVKKGVDGLELLKALPLSERLSGIHVLIEERDRSYAHQLFLGQSLNGALTEFSTGLVALVNSEHFISIWHYMLNSHSRVIDRYVSLRQAYEQFPTSPVKPPEIGSLDHELLRKTFAQASFMWKGCVTGYFLWKAPKFGETLVPLWLEAFATATPSQRRQLVEFIHEVRGVATPEMMRVMIESLPSPNMNYNILVAQSLRDTGENWPAFWRAAVPLLKQKGRHLIFALAMLAPVHLQVEQVDLDPSFYQAREYFESAPEELQVLLLRLLPLVDGPAAPRSVVANLAYIPNWTEVTELQMTQYLGEWAKDETKGYEYHALLVALGLRPPLNNPVARAKVVEVLGPIVQQGQPKNWLPVSWAVLQKALTNNSN